MPLLSRKMKIRLRCSVKRIKSSWSKTSVRARRVKMQLVSSTMNTSQMRKAITQRTTLINRTTWLRAIRHQWASYQPGLVHHQRPVALTRLASHQAFFLTISKMQLDRRESATIVYRTPRMSMPWLSTDRQPRTRSAWDLTSSRKLDDQPIHWSSHYWINRSQRRLIKGSNRRTMRVVESTSFTLRRETITEVRTLVTSSSRALSSQMVAASLQDGSMKDLATSIAKRTQESWRWATFSTHLSPSKTLPVSLKTKIPLLSPTWSQLSSHPLSARIRVTSNASLEFSPKSNS